MFRSDGVTKSCVDVSITTDGKTEADETFEIKISPFNGQSSIVIPSDRQRANVTIFNDDGELL